MQTSAPAEMISSTSCPETHRFIRAIRWTRLAFHIGTGLFVAGMIFPRVTCDQKARITQWWSQKTLRILNIVLSVHGAKPHKETRNLMIAANHISWLDIYVINAAHPARFVAKAEIREWPIIGWLCEKAGTIFIRRTHRRDTVRINDEMHDVLATGATVGLFPEGSTTGGDRLLKFHSSLLEPAIANQATLAPAALRYLSGDGERSVVAAYIDDISFSDSLQKIIRQKSMIAEITFAPSILAINTTRRALALQSEAAIAAILHVPIPDAHQRFGHVGNPDAATEQR
jgi:1-acyl-sn-glycerol-3-phosphate acyltransferase